MPKNVLNAVNTTNKNIISIDKNEDTQKKEFVDAVNMTYSEIVKLNHDIIKISNEINQKNEISESKVQNASNQLYLYNLNTKVISILSFLHVLFYTIICIFYYCFYELEDIKFINVYYIRNILRRIFFSSLFLSFMCEIYIFCMRPLFGKMIRIINMLILFFIFEEFFLTFYFEHLFNKIFGMQKT